jgi:hypothetical protein
MNWIHKIIVFVVSTLEDRDVPVMAKYDSTIGEIQALRYAWKDCNMAGMFQWKNRESQQLHMWTLDSTIFELHRK